MSGLGKNQQKILLLLLGGLTLAMNTSPQRSHKIIRAMVKDWKRINRLRPERSLKALEEKKYIIFKKKGQIFFPMLTAKGRHQAFLAGLQELSIPTPPVWDKLWRVVLFDIPEEERKIRNTLRQHLKRMHFFSLQESVFVHAYDCEKEIRRLSEYFGNGKYIRFIEAKRIDNETELKVHFKLR
ncbi:MAG: CRISPR-associated endonuclease Cas2 [bacterium]|nr:CRISPR-associated endonuclease Cas2 [bacterium]